MKTINVGKNHKAIIDDDDYKRISTYTWYYHYKGYAQAIKIINGKRKSIMMHRLVNRTPDNMYTDHINHNRLDNRKENLRTCTVSQNNYNKVVNNGKSKYQGVSYYKREKRWVAEVYFNNKRKCAGYFENEEKAARARDCLALKIHGKFARLNFPLSDYML